MNFPFVTLFDIPVSTMTLSRTADYLEKVIELRKPHQVITINPIMIMEGMRNPSFRKVLMEADLNVPDGAGVVWAANYARKPVSERVPGIDLMHELLARGDKKGYRVYLLGTDGETIATAAAKLQERYPGVVLAGYRDGYFGPEEDEEVVGQIREAKPDLLFVGRSILIQEPWIAKHKDKLNIPVMMGVGGSFDVIAGKLKRAPVTMQKLRLEWLYRLLQEPTRIGRMSALPRFVWTVMRNRKTI